MIRNKCFMAEHAVVVVFLLFLSICFVAVVVVVAVFYTITNSCLTS